MNRVLLILMLVAATPASARVVGHRPRGCPHAFCGCEASLFEFGKIIPALNRAATWFDFPRVAPAPRMAAIRRDGHHVMVLLSHVRGSIWRTHDGNSGQHLTRDHDVSIRGYVIVDPFGGRRRW